MLELDFDQVLGVLHGWLGEMVRVGVSVTAQPLQVVHVRGHLAAGSDMHDPYDEAEWEFTVGDDGGFAIHRDYFAGANLFPDSGHLIALMREDPEETGSAMPIEVHVGGPAAKCPQELGL
jgi:hypothetical protein